MKVTISRRAALALLTPMLAVPPLRPADAIVNGQAVSDAEAAAAGVVGLYIDLTGCTICRKGVPATCTGTLIAPDLVLSAMHCSDVPASLNGTLERVVFGSDMLRDGAPSLPIEKIVSTTDYGIEAAGNDLLLIKLKGTAPAPWRPVELPLAPADAGGAGRGGEARQPLLPVGGGDTRGGVPRCRPAEHRRASSTRASTPRAS